MPSLFRFRNFWTLEGRPWSGAGTRLTAGSAEFVDSHLSFIGFETYSVKEYLKHRRRSELMSCRLIYVTQTAERVSLLGLLVTCCREGCVSGRLSMRCACGDRSRSKAILS